MPTYIEQELEHAKGALSTHGGIAKYQDILGLRKADIEKAQRILDLGSGPTMQFAADMKAQYPEKDVISVDLALADSAKSTLLAAPKRSEERRVGKECRL